MTGEFDFEPLKGETAGEPIYLMRLSADALDAYDQDLERLIGELPALTGPCRHPEELRLISQCLANVRQDVHCALAKKQASS